MSERVLTAPLSGLEVRNAILDRISQRLSKDCFLSANLAYDSFEAKVTIQLVAHDVGREAAVDVTETIRQGDVHDNPKDEHLVRAEEQFEINPAPPNEVRRDSGQDIPVLTKDGDGRPVIRGQKYRRGQGKD